MKPFYKLNYLNKEAIVSKTDAEQAFQLNHIANELHRKNEISIRAETCKAIHNEILITNDKEKIKLLTIKLHDAVMELQNQ
jgi:hypothetical protein